MTLAGTALEYLQLSPYPAGFERLEELTTHLQKPGALPALETLQIGGNVEFRSELCGW